MQKDLQLAVLIDGDNIPARYIREMMEEIAKYGNPTIKRIYGDWTKPHLNKWKKVLLENAITPIQQYGYTTGKNATDSAMIIDAMDILYSNKVTGFCIVSSDSDFTRLATRLREANMTVFGIGERKTPNPFIVACDRFIYIEILKKAKKEAENSDEKDDSNDVEKVTPAIIDLIATTIDDLADDDGWAFLGEVGSLLQKKQPNFDSRNYGFQKLTPLVKSIDRFEIERKDTQKGRFKLIYVRNKEEVKPEPPKHKNKNTQSQNNENRRNRREDSSEKRSSSRTTKKTVKPLQNKPLKPQKGDRKALLKFGKEELILLQENSDQMSKTFGLDTRIRSLTGKRKVGFYKWELETLQGFLKRLQNNKRFTAKKNTIEQLLHRINEGLAAL